MLMVKLVCPVDFCQEGGQQLGSTPIILDERGKYLQACVCRKHLQRLEKTGSSERTQNDSLLPADPVKDMRMGLVRCVVLEWWGETANESCSYYHMIPLSHCSLTAWLLDFQVWAKKWYPYGTHSAMLRLVQQQQAKDTGTARDHSGHQHRLEQGKIQRPWMAPQVNVEDVSRVVVRPVCVGWEWLGVAGWRVSFVGFGLMSVGAPQWLSLCSAVAGIGYLLCCRCRHVSTVLSFPLSFPVTNFPSSILKQHMRHV